MPTLATVFNLLVTLALGIVQTAPPPGGEALFGLAKGYHRLGRNDEAREWLSAGTLAVSKGTGCTGCHK